MLAELTAEQFAIWKRHPVTAMVLERYLPDYRGALEREVMQGWLDGRLQLAHEQQTRGHIVGAHMLENLTLDRIRLFYGQGESAPAVPVRPGRY